MLSRILTSLLTLSILPVVPLSAPASEPEGDARLVEVVKIWDEAPHNAFTDLIRFQDRWFCTFREGEGHVSPDGAIRVLTSEDGQDWTSSARLTSDSADLRDPKLSITPEGRLMLIAAAALHQPAEARHQTMAWFSDEGRSWSEPVPIGDPDCWLWRVTWHDGHAFGVGYGTGGQRFTRLYQSQEGDRFETLVETLFEEGYPNETAMLFDDDGSALCLLRRDGDDSSALLGRSSPPYTEWSWTDLGTRFGGPALIRLPDGRLVAGGRLYDGQVRTALCWLDPEEGTLTEFLTLPSKSDTSYPGLVWHEDRLWVSYYSSHEGRTSIYLAQVSFAE